MFLLMFYLVLVCLIVVFMIGATGPDSLEKRDQDWQEFKEYMAKREQNKREGK